MAQETSMEDESDEGLFVYMACAESEEDQVLADMAYSELHRRYVGVLYRRCQPLCHTMMRNELAPEDLTSITLAKACKNAGSYRPKPSMSEKQSSRRTLAWLCQIARNLIMDQLRNPRRPGPLNSEELDVDTSTYSPEDFAEFFNDLEEPLNTPEEYRMVADVFLSLAERTQEVLLTTLIQRDRSPSKTHMLRGSATILAKRLRTSADNIRHVRREGIREINNSLKNHRKGKGAGR